MKGKAKRNKKYTIIAIVILALIAAITLILVNRPVREIMGTRENKIVEDKTGKVYEPLVKRATGNDIKEEEQESSLIDSYNIYKGLNEDTVAYIRIKDTTIDFPIVQQHTNCNTHHVVDNCYYLYRDILKRRAVNPTAVVFADCSNSFGSSIDKLDSNTVIYGHNWDNNEHKGKKLRLSDSNDIQFAQLPCYTNIDWLKAHPVLELNLGADTSYWVPVYIFYTDSLGPTAENGFNYFKRSYDNDDIDTMKERSVIYDELGIDVALDKSLTLSTCSYKYGTRRDLRFVTVFKNIEAESYEEAIGLAEGVSYIENNNPDTSWAK